MSDKALRYCLRQIARVIDMIEMGEISASLDTLNELVVSIAEQLAKRRAEG